MFLRFTALITTIIFSFNTLAFGQISAPEPRPFQPLQIIHIQDAHANYTAQKNICELIERFQKEQGIDLVFVEGAVGAMDAKNLQFSSNPSINKKVTDKLAQMGELSGADLYLLEEHAAPVQFVGLEDPKLYAKNLESFRAVFAREKETAAKLRAERAQLDLEASRLNNKNLLALLRHYLNFELEKNQIQKTVSLLDQLSRKNLKRNFRDAKEQKDFPNLVRLLRLMEDESKINLEEAKKEFSVILSEAKNLQLKSEILHFVQDDKTTRNPRFLLEEFYAAQPKGFDFSKYPNLSTLSKNRVYQYELKSQGLFDELLKLMTMLFDVLSVSESEKELIRRAKEYVTQSRLASLALTREEWEKFPSREGHTAKQGGVSEPLDLTHPVALRRHPSLEGNFNQAISFYQAALDREKNFLSVIDETMRKKKKQRAIVIAGGFHTEGLKSEFIRRGIDCQVVAPEIKEASREIYINSVLGNYRANLDRSQFPAADWDNGWTTQSEMKVPVTARQALVTELIAQAYGSSLGTNDARPNPTNLSEEDLVKNLIGQLNVKLPTGRYLGVYAGRGEEYFAAFEGVRFARVDLIDLTADTTDTFDSLMDLESLFGRKISKERIAGINAQAILKERERIRLKQKAIKQLAPSKQVEAKKPLVKKAKPQKKVEEPLPPYLALLRLVHAGKVGKALLRPVSDLELSKKAKDFLKSLSPDRVMTIGKLSKLVNDGIFNQPDIDKSIADEIMGKLDPLRVQHKSSYSLSDLQAMVSAGKMREVLAQPVTVFNFSPQTMFVLSALSWRDIRNDPFTIGELMHLDGEIILGAPQSDREVLKEIEKKLALVLLSLPDHGLLSRPISYLHLDQEAERDLKEISNDRFGREMTIRELLKPGWTAVIEQISEHPTATIANVRAKLKHFELDWEPEEGASSDGESSDGASLGAQEDLKKSISNTLRFWEANQFLVNSIWPPVSMPVKSYVQINARAGVRFRGVIAGRKRSEKVSGPGMSRSKKSGSLFPRKRMLVTPTMFFLVRNNLETALTAVEEGNLEIERLIQEPLDDFRNVIQEERIRGEARKFSESMEGNFIQIFEALGRAKEASAKSLGTDLSRLSRLTGFSRAQIEGMNAYTIESEDAKIGMYELISWALDADWYYQEASEKTKRLLLSAVSRRHRKAPSVLPRPVYEELDYKIGRDVEALQILFADFSRTEEKLFAELKKFWETEKIKAGRKYARRNLWRRSVPRFLKALDSMFEFELNSGWRDRVLDRLESKGFLELEQADKFTQSIKGLRERYQEKFKALELKAKELEKKLDQWDGKKNGSPSSSDVKMLRARLIKELEPYLDLISIAKKYRVTKRKPDVFFVLTNPDVRTFVELASIWKSFANVEEDPVQIPIVVSGGMRTGGKPQLLAHLSEYYRSKWPLSKLKEFQADSVTEAEIVKGILEFEGVAPEAISIEKESANTPESFMKAIYVLLRILEPKKGKSPVIQLVTCPPLNLRVRQTAYKQWKDFISEDGGWRILVRPIYPPVSYHRSDEELLHLFGYVLGFPKDYHVYENTLNRTSEVERIIEYSGKESPDVAPFDFKKFGWSVERVRQLREGLFKDYLMTIEPAAFGKSLGDQKNKPNFSEADFLKLEAKTGISAKVLQGYFAEDRKDSAAGEQLLIEKALNMVQILEDAGKLKQKGLWHYGRIGDGLLFRINGLSAKWIPAKDEFERNAGRVEWLFDRFFSRFKSFWEQERSRASVQAITDRTRFDSVDSAKTSLIRIVQHVSDGQARQALRESVEAEGFISREAAEKFLKDQRWLFGEIDKNVEKVREEFDLVSDFRTRGASLGAVNWQKKATLEKYAGYYPLLHAVFNSTGTRVMEIYEVNHSPLIRLLDAQTGLPVAGDLGKYQGGDFFGFSPDGALAAVNLRRITQPPSSRGIDLGYDTFETVNLYHSDSGNLVPGLFGKKETWEQVRGRIAAFMPDGSRVLIQGSGYVEEEVEIPLDRLTRAQRQSADPDSPPTEWIETNDRWFGLQMRDVKTGNPARGWERGVPGSLSKVSPSGKWIAVSDTIKVFNTKVVPYTTDHKSIFRLINSETGKPHEGILGKGVPGLFVAFAPRAQCIIKQEFQSGNSFIYLLNQDGLPASKEWESGIQGQFQGFTPDGSSVVISNDRSKFFYDIKTGKPAAASDIHSNNQTQDDFPAEANQRVIAYSPDHQTAIVVNPEGNAEVWKKQSDGKSLGESPQISYLEFLRFISGEQSKKFMRLDLAYPKAQGAKGPIEVKVLDNLDIKKHEFSLFANMKMLQVIRDSHHSGDDIIRAILTSDAMKVEEFWEMRGALIEWLEVRAPNLLKQIEGASLGISYQMGHPSSEEERLKSIIRFVKSDKPYLPALWDSQTDRPIQKITPDLEKAVQNSLKNASGDRKPRKQYEALENAVFDFISADGGKGISRAINISSLSPIVPQDIREMQVFLDIPSQEQLRRMEAGEGQVFIFLHVHLFDGRIIRLKLISDLKSKPIRNIQPAITDADKKVAAITGEFLIDNGNKVHFISDVFGLDDGSLARYGYVSEWNIIKRMVVKGYARGRHLEIENITKRVERARAQLLTRILWQPLRENLKPGERILDIAAGQGRDLLWMDQDKRQIVPLPEDLTQKLSLTDFMTGSLTEIRSRYPKIETIASDWRNIPRPEKSFSRIVGLNALGYMTNMEMGDVVRELKRLLVPAPAGTEVMTLMEDIMPSPDHFYSGPQYSDWEKLPEAERKKRWTTFIDDWVRTVSEKFKKEGFEIKAERIKEEYVGNHLPIHDRPDQKNLFYINIDGEYGRGSDGDLPAGKVREQMEMLVIRVFASANAASLGESKIESKLMRVNIRDLKKQLIFTGSLMAFVAFIFAFPDAFHDFFYQVRPLSPTFYVHEFLHGSWSVDHLDIPDWAKSMIQFPPIHWALSILEAIEHPISHWFVQKASDFMGIWGYAEKGKYVSNILPNFFDMMFGAGFLRASQFFHSISLEEGKWKRFFFISSYPLFFAAVGYFTFSVVYFISDTFGWDKSLHGGDYSGFSNFFFGLEPSGFRTFLCGAMVFSFGFFFVDGIRFVRHKISSQKNKPRFTTLAVSGIVFGVSSLTLAIPTLRFMQKNDRSQITGTEAPAPQMVDGRSLGMDDPDEFVNRLRQNLAGGFKEKSILTLGFGSRLSLIEKLKKLGADITEGDRNPDYLALVRQLFKQMKRRVVTKQLDISKPLPFQEQLFDSVVVNNPLNITPTQRTAFLSELMRVVKPSGVIVIYSEKLQPERRYISNRMLVSKLYEKYDYAKLAEAAGLQVLEHDAKTGWTVLKKRAVAASLGRDERHDEEMDYRRRRAPSLPIKSSSSSKKYQQNTLLVLHIEAVLKKIEGKITFKKFLAKLQERAGSDIPNLTKKRVLRTISNTRGFKKLFKEHVLYGSGTKKQGTKPELVNENKSLDIKMIVEEIVKIINASEKPLSPPEIYKILSSKNNHVSRRVVFAAMYSEQIREIQKKKRDEWERKNKSEAVGKSLGLAQLGHNVEGWMSVNELTDRVLFPEDRGILGEKGFDRLIGAGPAEAKSLGNSVTAVVTNDYFVQNATLLLKTMQRGDKIFVLVKTKSDIDNLKPFDKRIVPVRQSELKDLLSDKKNIFSLEFLTGDSLTVPAANRDMFRFKWDNDILTDLISNRDLLVKIRKFLLTDLEQRKTLLQQEGITPKGGFWFLDRSFVEFINKITASSLGTQALQRAA